MASRGAGHHADSLCPAGTVTLVGKVQRGLPGPRGMAALREAGYNHGLLEPADRMALMGAEHYAGLQCSGCTAALRGEGHHKCPLNASEDTLVTLYPVFLLSLQSKKDVEKLCWSYGGLTQWLGVLTPILKLSLFIIT